MPSSVCSGSQGREPRFNDSQVLRSEGGDVMGGSSEQFTQLLRTEVPRWGKIVKDSGASLD